MKLRQQDNFLFWLDEIAESASRKYPRDFGEGLEIIKRRNSKQHYAEVLVREKDKDVLKVIFRTDGKIQNDDDPREFFDIPELKERLIETLEQNRGPKIEYTIGRLQEEEKDYPGGRMYSTKRFSQKTK